MPFTRRTVLHLSLLLAVAGCTPSPVVRGEPGDAPEPSLPTRTAAAEAVASWVANFSSVVDELARTASAWSAGDGDVAWLTALQAQTAAHVTRLAAADPVAGGPPAFPAASPEVSLSAGPATPAEALAVVSEQVTAGLPVLRAGFASATNAQERLLHASLEVAVSASLTPSLPPVDGGTAPAPFDGLDTPQSLAVALGHVRALMRGLELGLGRLQSSDDLRAAGSERLDASRVLRNEILEDSSDELPEDDIWKLPNPMSTPAEIVAAWAVLETNLLNAFGGLVAAGGAGAEDWLDAMLGQVAWVHRWGGRLPYWPGWVATA